MSKELDKFIEQWRKETNTEGAVYSHYHYDAMEAYAKAQVIIELERTLNSLSSDWTYSEIRNELLIKISVLKKQNVPPQNPC